MTYKKNIYLDYFHTFFRSLNLTQGIWLLFLAYKGFSLFEIGIFETVFHISSLTMEVPTGMIADLFGRKFSRMLGIFTYLIYILILILSNNFVVVFIGFIFCGSSYAFESGSGEALVYDSLKEMNETNKFMKINGYKEVIFQTAGTIGLVLGGYFAMMSFELSFGLMFIIYLIALVFIYLMKETPKEKREHKGFKKMLYEHYVQSTTTVFKNKRLLYLMIIGAIMAAPITVIFFYLQNHLQFLGYTRFEIGIFLALHALFAAIGGLLAYRLENRFKERKILVFVPLFMTIAFWFILIDSIIIIPFVILGFLDSIYYVVLNDYMNKIIPSETRATSLSFFGLLFSIVMIIIFPIIGLIGDLSGLKIAFLVLAIMVSIFYLLLLRILSKNHLHQT